MRHKHADLIHAWAEGATIEFKHVTRWSPTLNNQPSWLPSQEYRIKPKTKKVVYCNVLFRDGSLGVSYCDDGKYLMLPDSEGCRWIGEADKIEVPIE